MEKVCVIGLGYIGLPTASLLATKGFDVLGVDCKQDVVDTINNGGIHIYEPDLDILVKSAVKSGHLKASVVPEEADIFIIAVPTPFKEKHVPDMSYVQAAARSIAPYVRNGNLVILESTSPVGTTEKIAGWLKEGQKNLNILQYKESEFYSGGQQVYLAHCPERVLPGQILKELVENDRIIGGINSESSNKTLEFYQKFVHGQIFMTNSRTAEMAKLTENSFRDVNIAFANELSLICDKLDINVWQLIELANRHPRVNILQPGPGVGGHCIAVDPWFIVDSAPEEAKLIHTARIVNDNKPRYVLNKIKEKADRFKNPIIACLGISFKANIDDLRESPSLEIVERLVNENIGKVLVVEPNIEQLPESLLEHNGVEHVDIKQAVHRADIVVLLVDHKVFRSIDKNILKEKIVIDTRGMWR